MPAQLPDEILLRIFDYSVQPKLPENWYFPVKSNAMFLYQLDYAQLLNLLCVYRPLHGRLIEKLYETVVIKTKIQLEKFVALIRPETRTYRLTVDWAGLVCRLIFTNVELLKEDINPLLACLRRLKIFAVNDNRRAGNFVDSGVTSEDSREYFDKLGLPFIDQLYYYQRQSEDSHKPDITFKCTPTKSAFIGRQQFNQSKDMLTIAQMYPSVTPANVQSHESLLLEYIGVNLHCVGYRSIYARGASQHGGLKKLHLCGSLCLLNFASEISGSNPQITHLRLVFDDSTNANRGEVTSRGDFDMDDCFGPRLRFISLENLKIPFEEHYDLFDYLPKHMEAIEIVNCEVEHALKIDRIREVLQDLEEHPFTSLKSLLISADSIYKDAADDPRRNAYLPEISSIHEICDVAETIAESWVATFQDDEDERSGPITFCGIDARLLRPYVNPTGFVRPETRTRLNLMVGAHLSDKEVESAVLALFWANCKQATSDQKAEKVQEIESILHRRGIDGGRGKRWAFGEPPRFVDKFRQTKITNYGSTKPPGPHCKCCRHATPPVRRSSEELDAIRASRKGQPPQPKLLQQRLKFR